MGALGFIPQGLPANKNPLNMFKRIYRPAVEAVWKIVGYASAFSDSMGSSRAAFHEGEMPRMRLVANKNASGNTR